MSTICVYLQFQVRSLDGLVVTEEARLRAQEDYMREIQIFNSRIDVACEVSVSDIWLA